MQGKFITLEGIDGSGKTTQLDYLLKYLQNKHQVELLREPGGTDLGEKIRELLLTKEHNNICAETELLLFSAARAQLVRERIKPLLEQGVWVVCDRFYDSTMAYQGYGRDLNKNFIEQFNNFAVGDIIPDLTLYLDIPVDLAISRIKERKGKEDRLDQESKDFMCRVREGYLTIAKEEPRRFKLIKADDSIDDVRSHIEKTLMRYENEIIICDY